jgi:hypothetical protein
MKLVREVMKESDSVLRGNASQDWVSVDGLGYLFPNSAVLSLA